MEPNQLEEWKRHFLKWGILWLQRKGGRGSVLDELSIWYLWDVQVEMSSQQWMTCVWNANEDESDNINLRVISIWIILKARRVARK